jgi:hypothetical protein
MGTLEREMQKNSKFTLTRCPPVSWVGSFGYRSPFAQWAKCGQIGGYFLKVFNMSIVVATILRKISGNVAKSDGYLGTSFSHNHRLSRGCKEARMHCLTWGNFQPTFLSRSTFEKTLFW